MTARPGLLPAGDRITVALPEEVRPIPEIAGAYLFVPRPHRDDRGFFSRTLDTTWLGAVGIDPRGFVQDSASRTRHGVIRGMHLRRGHGESKLVRCVHGVVFDAIVDLRPDSPTFRNVFTIELRSDPPVTLYVPAGCAHGFQSLTEPADITYRIDRAYEPREDVTIAWNDPDLAIQWPIQPRGMSEKDREAPSLTTVLRTLL
jgi:dTDP-4-dehydrorhamnose 3,5-epimerase